KLRPNGEKDVAADTPTKVRFLAPACARSEGSGCSSGHRSCNRVGEPALQADHLVVAPSWIERDLFDDVRQKIVRTDRCAVQQATGVARRAWIYEQPRRHGQAAV